MPETPGQQQQKHLSVHTLLFWTFAAAMAGMPLGTFPPTLFGLLALAIWIFSLTAFRQAPSLIRRRWLWPVYLMMALPWIGLTYSPERGGLGLEYAQKTYYWLYALALASIPPEKFRARHLITAFLAGLALNAFFGALQFAGLYPLKSNVASGLGRGYSTLSAYLVAAMLITSFFVKKANSWKAKGGLLLLVAAYFFHLVILFGRTGYLTFLVLSPLMVRNFFHRARIWKIAVVCTLLAGAMFLSPVVRERASLTVESLKYHLSAGPDKAWGRKYSPHQDRFFMWHKAASLFFQHPLMGVGTGGFRTRVKETSPPKTPLMAHPHNDILYMAVSYGIMGLFAFVWLFGTLLRAAWPRRDTDAGYFVLSATLVILFSGLFNAQILDAGMLFFLACVVGMLRWVTSVSGREVQERHKGTKAQRHKGTKAQRHKGTKKIALEEAAVKGGWTDF